MAVRRQAASGLFWLENLPLFLAAVGVGSAAMMVPAFFALVREDFTDARMFFYTGLLGLVVFVLTAVAIAGRAPRFGALGPLLSVFSIMLVLPVLLAVPFYEALQTTTFFNAYVEMVSAITTTGATLFQNPARLSPALHLWRAEVAWLGGFAMWTAAAAILAPLNLGGFEVTSRSEPGQTILPLMTQADPMEPSRRFLRTANRLAPIYVGLTGLVWLLLLIAGDRPFVALIHAMSVMSTSGISPVGGLTGATSGMTGEAVLLLFMVFALSRLTFSEDTVTSSDQKVTTDPEIRLALFIIAAVTALLFVRHWLGAFEVDGVESLAGAIEALWGALFTVASFLTTTGFVSDDWDVAQTWSGLETPGLVLVGLALIGGGVATTAGGVKLLRLFALYRHGAREMEQLVHPSSVSGARGQGRRLQRQGAYIAWVFFMLFALALALLCLAFSALELPFETAMILAIAGLSNTGPLLTTAASEPILLNGLSSGAKTVFCAAMVIGRLEILAIIALFTPELWRA